MAVLVSFTIRGRLKAKGRHHSRVIVPKNGGRPFAQSYPNKKTVEGEALIREVAAEAMAGRPPFFGPLILKILISINRTQSWSAKKKAAMKFVTGFPDIDNLAKSVADAVQGIIWQNDNQLCELHIRRVYDDTCGEHAKIWVMAPEARIARDVAQRGLCDLPLLTAAGVAA